MARRLRRWAGLLGLLAALLVACGAPAGPGEIKIGLIGVFSSEQETLNAAKLAIAPVNQAGGLELGGRRYTLALAVDFDQDKAEVAVRLATRMINQDQVVALVGPHNSSSAIPAGAVAEEARVPLISPLATNPRATAGRRYVFRVGFDDAAQGRALARFASGELGAATAAALYDESDVYSKGLAELFRQAFEAGGGRMVAFEPYAGGSLDFRAALGRIRAARPAVLLLPNRTAQCEQARQLREEPFAGAILGGDAWPPGLAGGCAALDGAFAAQLWQPDPASQPAAAFVDAYRQAYGRDPGATAALTYDAFGLLIAALRGLAAPSADQLRDALAATAGYQGVSGAIAYRGGGDPLKAVLVTRFADGRAQAYRTVEP